CPLLMLNFDHFVHIFPPILKILENPYMVFYGFSRIQGRHGWFTGNARTAPPHILIKKVKTNEP
ncbi:MAG: hypothetical protein U0L07_06395, partial [Clostridia bacterium]|nr:hypothetical protein [Clostridia bacterium]